MNNLDVYAEFKKLDETIRNQVQANNASYFNLGVKGGIFLCVELIDSLLVDSDKVENKEVLIVIESLKDLRAKLLEKLK